MAYGHLPHVPVGTYFTDRRSLYSAYVHRDIARAICGSGIVGRGAESVLLSGAKEDEVDLGEVVYSTGLGGTDRSGRQIADQVMEGLNASLAQNVDTGEPIRLIRLAIGGLRYDGLYEVEDAWIGPGSSGFQVCHYRFAAIDLEPLTASSDRSAPATTAWGQIGPVPRSETTHYRMKRDGRIPTLVKELYGYACQVCGIQVDTVAGPYAEGAHLVPLSGNGDDHTSNVLCLCPNHHVMLDHGGMAITNDFHVMARDGSVIGPLHVRPEHGLAPANAAAHRRLMGFD